MAFLRTHLEPALKPSKFQPQQQDTVLREDERKRNAFAKVCFHIAANPVRAALMKETEVWPDTGSIVPGYPKLNPTEEDFWPTFWKIYGKLRQPDAGDINRIHADETGRKERGDAENAERRREFLLPFSSPNGGRPANIVPPRFSAFSASPRFSLSFSTAFVRIKRPPI